MPYIKSGIIGYTPYASPYQGDLVSRIFNFDGACRGLDHFKAVDDYYVGYHGEITTGEIQLVDPGSKTSVKKVSVRTYCSPDTTPPDVIVMVRGIQDIAWRDAGDTTGSIAVSASACTGTGTAWSHTIAIGDGATAAFVLPCLASQARVYVGSVLQVSGTDYTSTSKTVTFAAGHIPALGSIIYAYWEVEPIIRVKRGHYIETPYGFHRINSIDTATALTLAWYPQETLTAPLVGTHHPAKPLQTGEGETAIWVNALVDSLTLRVIIVPRNTAQASQTVKLLGFYIEHIPMGKKEIPETRT